MDPKLMQEMAGIVALSSVWMLGVTQVRSMLWGLAVQGFSLGLLVAVRGIGEGIGAEIAIGVAIIALKGIAIPIYLTWSAKRLQVRRDKGAWLNPALSMLIGASLVAVCHFNGSRFSINEAMAGNAGLAISTVLTGLLLMVTRRLAISMLVGFLVIDNGIGAYALSQAPGLPSVVELGILSNLFLSVLLAGLVLFRVRSSFEHIDVRDMKELHE